MDAEAYPEAATNVLNILWKIGTQREVIQSSLWTRAQEAAFGALLQYEVGVFIAFIMCVGNFILYNISKNMVIVKWDYEIRLSFKFHQVPHYTSCCLILSHYVLFLRWYIFREAYQISVPGTWTCSFLRLILIYLQHWKSLKLN